MINYINNNINNHINHTNSNNTLSNKNEKNYLHYHNDNSKDISKQINRVNIYEENTKLINSKKRFNVKRNKEDISNQNIFDKDSRIEKTLSYQYNVKNIINKKSIKSHNKKKDLINKIKKYSLNINLKSITNDNGLMKKNEKNKTLKHFLNKNSIKINKEKDKDSKYLKFKKEIFDKVSKEMIGGLEKSGKKIELNLDIRNLKSNENKKKINRNIKVKSTTLETENIIYKIKEKIKDKNQTEIYRTNSNIINHIDKNENNKTIINNNNSNEKVKKKRKDTIINKKRRNAENEIINKLNKNRIKNIIVKIKETMLYKNINNNNHKEKEEIGHKEESSNKYKNINIINKNKIDEKENVNEINCKKEIEKEKEKAKKEENNNIKENIVKEENKDDNNKENIINENIKIKEIEAKKEDNLGLIYINHIEDESQYYSDESNDAKNFENYYIDIKEIKVDCQIPKEYINIIYRNLLMEEEKDLSSMPKYEIIKSQKEINEQMRCILVDWIIDVHYKFGFTDETLFMSILIIDRYISIRHISRIRFQLLGITAMMLACKHEEINIPKVEDFIYITDNAYTKTEVIDMESDILNAFNYELLYPSPIKFFEILSLKFNFNKLQYLMGKYLMESFLVDLKWINYKPSVISCACIYIVMKFYKMPNYHDAYNKKYCNLNENDFLRPKFSNEYDIKECAKHICSFVDNINKTNYLSCKNKYASKENEKISLIVEGKEE